MGFSFADTAFAVAEEHAANELAAPWWVFSLVVFLALCGLAIITCTFVNASYRHTTGIGGQDLDLEQENYFS